LGGIWRFSHNEKQTEQEVVGKDTGNVLFSLSPHLLLLSEGSYIGAGLATLDEGKVALEPRGPTRMELIPVSAA